jgi:hypothetical protein
LPNQSDLPYFDETQNEYVAEINRQDAYLKRGGSLSPSQMIKYENRVAMLVERLMLILDALGTDAEAVHDYLSSIEHKYGTGELPKQVYTRFMEKIHKTEEDLSHRSERDRDRNRVIGAGPRMQETSLSDRSVDELLVMHSERTITSEVLFQQFSRRERAGMRLQRIDPNLWGRYRSWVAEQRRKRRQRREDAR